MSLLFILYYFCSCFFCSLSTLGNGLTIVSEVYGVTQVILHTVYVTLSVIFTYR